jgi:penicillin-binding protein 1C
MSRQIQPKHLSIRPWWPWILLTGGLFIFMVWIIGFLLLRDLPDLDSLPERLQVPSIRITDRHGALLYESLPNEGGRHAVLPIQNIPLALQQATIATEDANFYQHPGVDPAGILRAFWINLRGGETLAGGSTITQQVARNLFLDPEERFQRSLRRKLRESWLAWQLARRYSKDEVLGLYLNQIYYGGLAYGVEAAAQTYFGKTANELDLAECALLAGLPQAPAYYDPLSNPNGAKERQLVVLSLMEKVGFISPDQRQLAEREPLVFESSPYPLEAPHFVLWVRAQLEGILAPEAFTRSLIVQTSLDLAWQQKAEEAIQHQLDELHQASDLGYNVNNAALVALHPNTGEILAMVGSPNYFDADYGGAINMALIPRQPGSALKPIIYAAAFDPERENPLTAASMILDVRTTFLDTGGAAYTPHNYDRLEHGPVTVRQALGSSLNIPAVITLEAIGLDSFTGLASDLGITSLDDIGNYNLAIALGGWEVSLLELSAAYSAFANGGQRIEPISILDISDAAGNNIYRVDPSPGIRVLDSRVAWLTSDILSDNDARRISFGENSILKIGRAAAVKTGTTSNFHDNWTIGYTPEVVVGVWVGNTGHEPMRGITGLTGAAPVWHQFMRTILNNQPEKTFEQPPGLIQMEVCALSGLLPTEACPYRQLEWFIEGTQPTTYDSIYQQVEVDTVSGQLANENTPPERRTMQTVLDLPPEAQPWARSQGLILLSDIASPHFSLNVDNTLHLISPGKQESYLIAADLPLESQQVPIEAVGEGNLENVGLWVDGQLLATFDGPPYKSWWTLLEGKHQAWAQGTTPEGVSISSPVVEFTVTVEDE